MFTLPYSDSYTDEMYKGYTGEDCDGDSCDDSDAKLVTLEIGYKTTLSEPISVSNWVQYPSASERESIPRGCIEYWIMANGNLVFPLGNLV